MSCAKMICCEMMCTVMCNMAEELPCASVFRM